MNTILDKKVNKIMRKLSIVFFVLLFLPVSSQAMFLNYIVKLEKDGSGTLTLMYWEKDTDIKAKNSVIGNFPFSANKSDLASKFTAPGISILSSELMKYPQDNSFTQAQVVLQFSDISKLGSLGALSGMNVNTFATDTGKIVSFAVTPEFVTNNALKAIYTILSYDGEILFSSDKKIVDKKRAEWYRGSEYIKSAKPLYFVALLKSDGEGKTSEQKKEDEGKSCGLFGIELPIIVLLGYCFPKAIKRAKKFTSS